MYVLFVVLNQPEYLPDVLYRLKKLRIRGATVIDSMGATSITKDLYKIPMIGGFMKSMDGDTHSNKTVFSVIERDDQVQAAMESIEEIIGGDMKQPNKGIMFALPVSHMRGGELNRHIISRDTKLKMAREAEAAAKKAEEATKKNDQESKG